MPRISINPKIGIILIALFSTALKGQIPQDVRLSINQIIGAQGAVAPDGESYQIILPREEATIVWDYQTLSPNLGLNSWAAFRVATRGQGIFTGQLLLLEDEVDSVVSTAMDSGLKITGLSSSSVFNGPHLDALDITATGTFSDLAKAFRRCLDQIQQVRRTNIRPKTTAPDAPLDSSIAPAPLDAVLSMRGSVVGGTYRSAFASPELLSGEEVGPEIGMNTWISVAGTNDRAVAHGEIVASQVDLQRVIRALRQKGVSIISITCRPGGDHPEFRSVQFRGEGPAIDLVRAFRYALGAPVS
jgi:hypothetical protein